jgi:RNA polymerase sigma-70 factor (ECF subfamily)
MKTPQSLLQRLRQCPTERDWQQFVILFTPLLARWCHRLDVPFGDREDLLQEVFTMLVKQLPEFRYDPDRSFRAWLWTLLHRRVIRWREEQKRPLRLSEDALESLASPESVPEARQTEYLRTLVEASLPIVLGERKPQEREIFERYALKKEPPEQIAAELKISRNQVYLTRSRVLARLRELIQDIDS